MVKKSLQFLTCLIILLIVGFVFLFGFPTGYDVDRSREARSKITETIARSKVSGRSDVNVVLQKEVHWGSAAVIKNPYPDVDHVYELISTSKDLKNIRPLLLIFRDGNMKEIERRTLK